METTLKSTIEYHDFSHIKHDSDQNANSIKGI